MADAAREAAIAAADPGADVVVLDEIAARWDDTVGVEVVRVVVFNAPQLDAVPSASCRSGVVEPGCNVYATADVRARPTVCTPSLAGGWCPADRRPDDLVGVWVEARFDSLSGATPIGFTWDDAAVAVVEPEIVE